MQIKTAGIITLVLIFLISCKKEEIPVGTKEAQLLEGYWVNRQVTDSLVSYKRAGNLLPEEYGFAFLSGGKFIERKNAGWCGTPPISYDNFTGSWDLTDSIINIAVDFWGGNAMYHWKVVSINDERLTISVVSEDYSQEN